MEERKKKAGGLPKVFLLRNPATAKADCPPAPIKDPCRTYYYIRKVGGPYTVSDSLATEWGRSRFLTYTAAFFSNATPPHPPPPPLYLGTHVLDKGIWIPTQVP